MFSILCFTSVLTLTTLSTIESAVIHRPSDRSQHDRSLRGFSNGRQHSNDIIDRDQRFVDVLSGYSHIARFGKATPDILSEFPTFSSRRSKLLRFVSSGSGHSSRGTRTGRNLSYRIPKVQVEPVFNKDKLMSDLAAMAVIEEANRKEEAMLSRTVSAEEKANTEDDDQKEEEEMVVVDTEASANDDVDTDDQTNEGDDIEHQDSMEPAKETLARDNTEMKDVETHIHDMEKDHDEHKMDDETEKKIEQEMSMPLERTSDSEAKEADEDVAHSENDSQTEIDDVQQEEGEAESEHHDHDDHEHVVEIDEHDADKHSHEPDSNDDEEPLADPEIDVIDESSDDSAHDTSAHVSSEQHVDDVQEVLEEPHVDAEEVTVEIDESKETSVEPVVEPVVVIDIEDEKIKDVSNTQDIQDEIDNRENLDLERTVVADMEPEDVEQKAVETVNDEDDQAPVETAVIDGEESEAIIASETPSADNLERTSSTDSEGHVQGEGHEQEANHEEDTVAEVRSKTDSEKDVPVKEDKHVADNGESHDEHEVVIIDNTADLTRSKPSIVKINDSEDNTEKVVEMDHKVEEEKDSDEISSDVLRSKVPSEDVDLGSVKEVEGAAAVGVAEEDAVDAADIEDEQPAVITE